MLVRSQKLLEQGRKNKYALGAFNVYNLETVQAVVSAAQKLNKPVVVQTSEASLKYAGIGELLNIVRTLAFRASVPVVAHLDHGKEMKFVEKVIRYGLHTSVMYDGSRLPLEENIENTRRVVVLAHKAGMDVEAELGTITTNGQTGADQIKYTDPEQAVEFVEKTGCDSLAVAFGNIHGAPTSDEKLNFEVLKSVAEKVSIPLVFHGASNAADEDYRKAIELGVAKINIDTQLRQAFMAELKKNIETIDPREPLGAARNSMQKVVEEKINQFYP